MTKTRRNTLPSTRSRTRRPNSSSSTATRSPKATYSGVAKALIAGGTVVAVGAGATAAILQRRQVARIAAELAAEAASAGHSVGAFGGRLGKSLMRQTAAIDLTRRLARAGLIQRPSMLRRLLPSMGIAALVAAAGAAFVLIGPKLRAAADPWNLEKRIGEPRSATPGFAGDSHSEHNSTGPFAGGAPRVVES
jgi:hypothetical protein